MSGSAAQRAKSVTAGAGAYQRLIAGSHPRAEGLGLIFLREGYVEPDPGRIFVS
jgi:hypothetical protein